MLSLTAFQGAIELGLIYALVALGIFISYRVLDVADLTVDSSFTLGAAVSAIVSTMGQPILGLGLAILAGAFAGLITATLQTKLGVQPILAGIITMIGLYSINLRVMGNKSLVPLLRQDTLFTYAAKVFPASVSKLIVVLLMAGLMALFVILFLRTPLGLAVRATGDNKDMVSASSINPNFTKTVGLCMANAIVAFAGGLLAQYQQSADINMGVGMVIIGLASLIIGEVILGRRSITRNVLAVIIGAIVYRIIIAFSLRSSVSQSDLKLISALIVTAAISYPAIKAQMAVARLRKAGKKNVISH